MIDLTYTEKSFQAAVLHVHVDFDDEVSTEWCPVPEITFAVVIQSDEAVDILDTFEPMVEDYLEEKDLLRRQYHIGREGEFSYTNISSIKIVGGYIGTSDHNREVELSSGVDEEILLLLQALWSDEYTVGYEATLLYIGNFHNNLRLFDPDEMEGNFAGTFSRDIDFMKHMVIEYDYPVHWIDTDFDASEFRHTYNKFELQQGGAVYFKA